MSYGHSCNMLCTALLKLEHNIRGLEAFQYISLVITHVNGKSVFHTWDCYAGTNWRAVRMVKTGGKKVAKNITAVDLNVIEY